MGNRSIVEVRWGAKAAQSHVPATFWLDVALLVSLCALETVPFTGLVIHEWLGLALAAMVFAHLLFSWNWIVSQSRRWFRAESLRARINYLLNLSLFAGMSAVIFSGILISQKSIPSLTGRKAAREVDWRWDLIHDRCSTWVLILAGMHLAINWDRALASGQKVLRLLLEDMQ